MHAEPAGVLAGYRILNVLYQISSQDWPGAGGVKWKSILVQVGPDRYREMYHLQGSFNAEVLHPARVVPALREPVFSTLDRVSGTGHFCWEAYWRFDQAGAHPLDLSVLNAAIHARLPANTTTRVGCPSFNLARWTAHAFVAKVNPRCCGLDGVGEISVRARLDGVIVRPVTISYKALPVTP